MQLRNRSTYLLGVFFAILLAGLVAPLQGQDKIPLIVRMGDVSINKVPFLVAMDQGLYAKHGLDVTLIPYSAGAAEVHGVPDTVSRELRDLGDDAQISIGGGAPGMVGKVRRSRPDDRVIIATTDHIVHWDIVAQEGIERVEDLKGKRIAISSISACTGVIVKMLAEKMGWDVDQDIAVLQGDYSVTPLEEDWADALIAYDVPLAMAMSKGYKPLDYDMRAWNEPIPCSGAWASRSWAHENKAATIGFLKALSEAISMMKQDRRVAFSSIAKWYDFNDIEVQSVIYNGAAEMPKKPYPAVAAIKRMMELYDSAAMRLYKAEDFYDDSFMKEIDESGFIDNLYK
jgi:NitT/TauT family transport system substrate-binding protein